MIPVVKKIGLSLAAFIGACYWLLPLREATGFILTLAAIAAVIGGLGAQMRRVKPWLAPVIRFRFVGPVLVVIGVLLPMFVDDFTLRLYSELLILGLLAMSLDVMMGFLGLASFAHAALAGISSYAVAIILTELDWHPWLAIFFAIGAGTLATVIMGAFSVRVRDIYFGIITLVFGSVFFIIANSWAWLTNGEDGLTITLPVLSFFGLFEVDTSDLRDFWYLSFGVVFLCYAILRQVMLSPVGLVFQGIRENEERTAYVGYNVNHFKILGTAISGFFTAISGVLTLLKSGIIGPEQMDALSSGAVVIWAIIGGLGTLAGPLIGASFVALLANYLIEFTERYVLIIGLLFIVIILLAPRGIVGSLKVHWRGS